MKKLNASSANACDLHANTNSVMLLTQNVIRLFFQVTGNVYYVLIDNCLCYRVDLGVKYAVCRLWPPPPPQEKVIVITEPVEVGRVQSEDKKMSDACNIMENFPDKVFNGINNGSVLQKLVASLDKHCQDFGGEVAMVSS